MICKLEPCPWLLIWCQKKMFTRTRVKRNPNNAWISCSFPFPYELHAMLWKYLINYYASLFIEKIKALGLTSLHKRKATYSKKITLFIFSLKIKTCPHKWPTRFSMWFFVTHIVTKWRKCGKCHGRPVICHTMIAILKFDCATFWTYIYWVFILTF